MTKRDRESAEAWRPADASLFGRKMAAWGSPNGVRPPRDQFDGFLHVRPLYQKPHPKNSGIYPEKPGKSPENPRSETDAVRIDALCAWASTFLPAP